MGGESLQPLKSLTATNFQSRSVRLLLDVAFWNVLGSLGAPFRRFLALLLFMGRSFSTIVTELQRWVLSTVGWLSAPPSLPILRHLGQSFLHTRRWHFGAGMPQYLSERPLQYNLPRVSVIYPQDSKHFLSYHFLLDLAFKLSGLNCPSLWPPQSFLHSDFQQYSLRVEMVWVVFWTAKKG